MANLQEMLKSAHVEWKKLGEVCEISSGGDVPKHAFSKQKSDEYSIPVVSNGTGENSLYGYTSTAKITQHAVTVSARGTIGYVAYRDYPYYPIVRLLSLIPKLDGKLEAKYLYYCLSNREFLTPTTGIPQLTIPMIKDESIPIPPIEVQIEIVRILNAFNTLTEELLKKLSTELTLRKKQYAYYLEKLLSEEGLKKCARMLGEDEKLSFYKLKEIFNIRNGYTPSKSKIEYWENGNVPWFRMEDIRTCGNILDDSILHVSQSAIKGSLFKKDSIILSTSATIGEHALIRVPFLANQRFTSFSIKDEFFRDINIKYTFYYFYLLDEWCKNNVKIGHFASVDMDNLILQVIPVPPPKVQSYVVGMLDKFSALIAETEGALPAEIEMRKKQYEYYRDALLKFERK